MKLQTIRALALRRAGRLDSAHFWAPADGASELLERLRASGLSFLRLGGKDGVARIWAPGRFKRAYAAAQEPSVPYLRPHDVFNYLPRPADLLSSARTRKLSTYLLKQGMILQTCSGRNLGPAVLTDAWLARFALSHDMLRVEIDDEALRLYVLCYLKTRIGQQLIRKDKTGSVIDHISDRHLAEQDIPLVGEPTFSRAVHDMRDAVQRRERARLRMHALMEEFDRRLPRRAREAPLREGWTMRTPAFTARLDAAFYDPLVEKVRSELLRSGGVRVRDVAQVTQPGRYKRQYTQEGFGLPMLSGAQLLQSRPVHPQFILPQSFDNLDDYVLREGWIAYPSDGRAEEGLGTPVYITADRDGWLASNMVGRVIPHAGTDVGWLYLALSCEQAQMQLKARSFGSVVDHTYPVDMEEVVVPPPAGVNGADVVSTWEEFMMAQAREDHAVRTLQDALVELST